MQFGKFKLKGASLKPKENVTRTDPEILPSKTRLKESCFERVAALAAQHEQQSQRG